MSSEQLQAAFQHWIDHQYTEGMTTREALRSAFEVGATSGAQAQRERDLNIALEEKRKYPQDNSDDPDYDQGYYEAAFEIWGRINGDSQ